MRCDIAGVIGFVERRDWPSGATEGDFIELVLRRGADLWDHPDRMLFGPPETGAVRGFFQNGGDTAHLFGVCVRSLDDLNTPAGAEGVLAPLFDRLRCEDDISLMLVPAAAWMGCDFERRTGKIRAHAEVIYDLLLAHCREMSNRFLLMDAPIGLHGDLLRRWAKTFRSRRRADRSYGALYYPWLMRGDECFPPSGAVAGTYARLEIARRPHGVIWPPANVPIHDSTHTEIELTWEEAGELADEAINPIVVQPGRGIIAFGARTLSDDSRFRFVNSRRIVNMVLEQLRRDSEWAVFEINNPHLWDVLQRDLLFRLGQFAGVGLLEGRIPGEDFFVKCDAETNPMVLRDAGQVNIQIMMRPVGAVEHILVDLQIGGQLELD